VTIFLRFTLSTKLVKLCGVPLLEVRALVWVASPRTLFRVDLSLSNADIDLVFLKLKPNIKTGLSKIVCEYSPRVTGIDSERMVFMQRPESLVLDVDSEIVL